MLSCPAAEMVDGSEVLYLEQVTHLLLLCCTAVIDVNVCFFSFMFKPFFSLSSGILEDSSETISSSMHFIPFTDCLLFDFIRKNYCVAEVLCIFFTFFLFLVPEIIYG